MTSAVCSSEINMSGTYSEGNPFASRSMNMTTSLELREKVKMNPALVTVVTSRVRNFDPADYVTRHMIVRCFLPDGTIVCMALMHEGRRQQVGDLTKGEFYNTMVRYIGSQAQLRRFFSTAADDGI